jgi:hypothetical protein
LGLNRQATILSVAIIAPCNEKVNAFSVGGEKAKRALRVPANLEGRCGFPQAATVSRSMGETPQFRVMTPTLRHRRLAGRAPLRAGPAAPEDTVGQPEIPTASAAGTTLPPKCSSDSVRERYPDPPPPAPGHLLQWPPPAESVRFGGGSAGETAIAGGET